MLFISILKALFFLSYLNICPDYLDHVENWLDQKVKVNFKIYDITIWEAKN